MDSFNPHWSNQYIGMPYSTFNCAELCRLALKEVFGYEMCLPQMPRTVIGMGKAIESQEYRYPEIDKPFEGCLVLMKARGVSSHIGLYTKAGNRDNVLHAMKSAGQTILTPFDRLYNIGLKIEGFYGWP